MIETIEIDDWSQYVELALGERFRSWAFRGQADAGWRVYSTLSRVFIKMGINQDVWEQQERRALRIFQRKAHLFLSHVPAQDDAFHWLSIMQHHGGPTRLVDFTWSPFVAAFFALERAEQDAAVFAICPPPVASSAESILPPFDEHEPASYDFRGTGNYTKYFQPNEYPIIYLGEPYVMNQRLIAQEGTFLVPGVLDQPIDELVAELPDCNDAVVKFVLKTGEIRRDAMRALYAMNVTNATLFPGLDGLARSMAYELEYHWAYDPVTMVATPRFDNPRTGPGGEGE